MQNLFYIDKSTIEKEDLIGKELQMQTLNQFLNEQRLKVVFEKYQLPVANKLLLYGHSGCGKTMTAKWMANQLNKKLVIVNLATIVSSKLGETAKNLDLIFKEAQYEAMILLLDELDLLAQWRNNDMQDNAEMKRVVNALIQLIDYLPQKSILIGATNQIDMIDVAIKRRFNYQIVYDLPSQNELDLLYQNLQKNIPKQYWPSHYIYNISYAEAKEYFQQKVKQNIIDEHLRNQAQ